MTKLSSNPDDVAKVLAGHVAARADVSFRAIPVIPEWPNYAVELEIPSISVITHRSQRLNDWMPYTVETLAIPDDPINVIELRSMGEWQTSIQLDIWAGYKEERVRLFEMIMGIFEEDDKNGLTLKVIEDQDQALAHYHISDYYHQDGPQSSQNATWRGTFDISCHFDRIVGRKRPKILETSIQAEVS